MNINRTTSHASAFISSTFLDLREERKAVAKVLKEANLNISALDTKPASNNKSKEEILDGIQESDFIILIVSLRYGSIIPEMTGSEKYSITKWEYIQARRNKKDILVFFKQSNNDSQVEYETESSSQLKLLDEFKNQLSRNHNPKYFSTISELEEEVKKALIPTYRAGVMSLLSKHDILRSERNRLSEENNKLQQENKRLKEITPTSSDQLLGAYKPNLVPQLGSFKTTGITSESLKIATPKLGMRTLPSSRLGMRPEKL